MIRVNNKDDLPWRPGMTVRGVLEGMRFTHRRIVVSVDGVIVPPDEYDSRQVPDGADVRVIHIIGGG